MPVTASAYSSLPRYLYTAHLQTVIPGYIPYSGCSYQRERLALPDGDFVDLLETPRLGDHVGFMAPRSLFTYAERRALAFALGVSI